MVFVDFKRKLAYDHPYKKGLIRPHCVLAAAHWLMENSKLFREEGITFRMDWDPLATKGYDPELITVENEDSPGEKWFCCMIQRYGTSVVSLYFLQLQTCHW